MKKVFPGPCWGRSVLGQPEVLGSWVGDSEPVRRKEIEDEQRKMATFECESREARV